MDPQELSVRVQNIVLLLPAAMVPADLEPRVRAFIKVNGYAITHRAATRVAEKHERGALRDDAWKATVAIVNAEHALANLLQAHLHWVELGLRSRLDLVFTEAFGGSAWHLGRLQHQGRARDPRQTVRESFNSMRARRHEVGIPELGTLPTGDEALTYLTLGEILNVVRDAYDYGLDLEVREEVCTYLQCDPFQSQTCPCATSGHRHSTSRYLRSDQNGCRVGTVDVPANAYLPGNKVKAIVRVLRDARNKVDHAEMLPSNLYAEVWRDTRHLLASLGFDLSKATPRFERQRLNEVHRVLVAVGLPDGVQSILTPS